MFLLSFEGRRCRRRRRTHDKHYMKRNLLAKGHLFFDYFLLWLSHDWSLVVKKVDSRGEVKKMVFFGVAFRKYSTFRLWTKWFANENQKTSFVFPFLLGIRWIHFWIIFPPPPMWCLCSLLTASFTLFSQVCSNFMKLDQKRKPYFFSTGTEKPAINYIQFINFP